MSRSLLFYGGLLMAGLLGSQPAQAQYVVAGQAAGATYVDVVPDKVLIATVGGVEKALDSLDLDADGRFDLRFINYSYRYANNRASENTNITELLHDDINSVACNIEPFSGSPYMQVGFTRNDSIQQRIAQPTAAPPPYVWANLKTRSSVSTTFYLTQNSQNPGGQPYYGFWLDRQDHYLGVRLRTGSTGAWRYGWVRLQVTSTGGPVTLVVKDYALSSSTPLAQQPARAAGWQLYPVPTTGLLTVQSAAATTGQLTLSDAQGRVLLRRAFAGTSQQLDLSALAVGLYLIRLETSAGSFSQRITRQ